MALPTGVSRAWTSTLAILLFCAPLVGQTHETLHSFAKDQGLPRSRPLEASDGNLYGTSSTGGVYGRGSVYHLTPDGSGGWAFSTVASFRGGPEGGDLSSWLIEASDGFLYGSARAGGNQDQGTIFRVDDMGTITVIHTFMGPEGSRPFAGLVEGPGGILYGTASGGGATGRGTVFSVELSGANFTVLHDFTPQEGFPEKRGLILGSDGLLYGTAYYPGIPGLAVAFSLSTTGVWTTLHTFGGFDGDFPEGGLVEGDDGLFYGTTFGGGVSGSGTFYSIDSEGNFTIVRESFDTGEGEIFYPGGLWRGSDGNFYGASGLSQNSQGTFYQLGLGGGLQFLHEFDGVSSPVGGVMQASDGFFYGSTEFGGPTPYGTVFRIDTAGQHELLHSFAGAEGSHPICRLIESPAGTLLGTTNTGGAHGMGTAFSSSTEGAVTVFHDFAGADGSYPGAGLVDGADGFSYGVTTSGGANGQGTFFRMDATGQLFVLRDFTEAEGGGLFQILRGSDGNFYGSNRLDVVKLDATGTLTPLHAVPGSPDVSDSVIQGSDGDLYGTTYYGGAFTSGTVYHLTLDGATWTTLHEFTGIEGAFPVGGLIEASDGRLYGSTRNGGLSNSNGGALYRIDKSGQFESLYSFSGAGDGLFGAGLIEASDGLLYGATEAGGSFQLGTVFRLDKNGDVVVLHSFGSGPDDGHAPNFQLHEGADGLLYGASFTGGAFGGGTLFRIDPGATFPVLSVTPTSGDPNGGTSVVITGEGFQPGATVRIGTAAAPAALTLGASEVEVTTPLLAGGSLNHIAVMNPDGTEGALSRAFFASFYDVPQTDQAHDYVEKIFRAGVTAGCSGGSYCRYADVNRAQMAVFMLRVLLGNRYYPPPATGTMFSDVPADSFAAAWIEDLASRGITAGCGDGVYCPTQSIRRSQMAVFLLKTLLGASYNPPPATGTVFADVPADAFAADFIEDLATRGISGGCLENPLRYCPTSSTNRAQMAIFLVKTFGLP